MEEQVQEQAVIIETVDDGEVGYMPPVEETVIVETVAEPSEMEYVEEVDRVEQYVEQITAETLPVVYVADKLPNTGTGDYGVIMVVAILLIVSGFGLLFSRKDN